MTDSTFDRKAEMASLRRRHKMGHETEAEEVWEQNSICTHDGSQWPCDTIRALNLASALPPDAKEEIHIHLDQVLRTLRWHFQPFEKDPATVPNDESGYPSQEGLPTTMAIHTNVIVSVARKVLAALDVVDGTSNSPDTKQEKI